MSEETEVITKEPPVAVEAPATEKAFTDTFRESLTDPELKDHKMWDNLKGKSADEMGKYIRELKSFTGKKGDIPKSLDEGGTQDEWDAFHTKLGRPDSSEGYDWQIGDDFTKLVGEQAPFYEKIASSFKEAAFKRGMSTEGAEEIFNDVIGNIAEQFEAVDAIRAERETEVANLLKNEWGDSSEGIELGIKAMLKEKGGLDSEAVDALISDGLFKEPKLAVALGKISAKFSDDPEIGAMHTGTKAGLVDQKMSLETKMIDERSKYGAVRPETIAAWQAILNKMGDDL